MVSGVICFVAENPVRAVASTTITWLSKWYKEVSPSKPTHPATCKERKERKNTDKEGEKQNSIVFVSHRHMVWEGQESNKKQFKRYGRLVKSTEAHTLNEMLVNHKEDVFKWIEERVEAEASESSS